jgi:ferredoxin
MSYRPLHIVKFKVDQQRHISVVVSPGTTLIEAAQRAGLDAVSICGGQHDCGQCLVKILDGSVSAIDPDESDLLSYQQLDDGYRLACCVRANGPVIAQFGDEGEEPAQLTKNLTEQPRMLEQSR